MKRLFVSRDARGSGLGKKLITARIDAARAFGWDTVYADTFKGNTTMLSLYQKLGFQPCDAYEGNGNYAALMPVLVFRKLAL